ncbi:MAG: hypothetical protein ACRD1Y_15000 [Terriglobales bacterium]
MPGLRAVLLLLMLAVAAAAVQPVYRVSADTIFLPLDGVALNAHTGRVVWRFPRYRGQTYTDGHGLLLLSWMAAVAPHLHVRTFRLCRLRTSDGHKLWCHDFNGLRQWVVDNTGRRIYLLQPERLQVLTTSDGQPDRGFALPGAEAGEQTLMPMPQSGVLLLARERGRVREALSYRPGAAGLNVVPVPGDVYPFRGNGRGLLLYAKPHGEFFLAEPFRLLFGRHQPAPENSFPLAKLDESGFFFTDWQGSKPVVRGGTYRGVVWKAPRKQSHPQMAITGGTAVMLERLPDGSSRLEGRTLEGGELQYGDDIAARVGTNPRLYADDGGVVVKTATTISLYDAARGSRRWEVRRDEGTLASIAGSAIVFWHGSGVMEALARNNGALLWRIRFRGNRH